MRGSGKRPRFFEGEMALRSYFADSLKPKFGAYQFEGETLINFPESSTKILCIFSRFNKEGSKWFWGISSKYWKSMPYDYLSLLFENDIGGFSYLLLNHQETKKLLNLCGTDKSGEHKKINMRIYQSEDLPRFEKDKRFDVAGRTKRLYPPPKA